jgi:hypothetical protein
MGRERADRQTERHTPDRHQDHTTDQRPRLGGVASEHYHHAEQRGDSSRTCLPPNDMTIARA